MKFQGIPALTVFALVAFTITRVKTITIDNQLVIIANDCYTRIAIGSTLPAKDVYGNAKAATVTECEDECSRKRNSCETFSFGISSKGNASCVLGSRVPNGDELVPDSDYDIYIRQQSSPNCMPDRIYKLGSGKRNPTDFNPLASRYPIKNPIDTYKINNDRDKEEPIDITAKPNTAGSIIPGPGGFGTVTIERPNPDINNPHERPSGSNGFQILTLDPNAEKNHHNNYGSHNHHSGYQVTEVTSQFGYPGPVPFDEDNPNGPYTYASKIPYGLQNGQSQTEYGSPNFGNSVTGKHKDTPNHFYGGGNNYFYAGDRNSPAPGGDRNYYVYTIETGNRYGINVYEEAPSRANAMSCYRKLFGGKRLAEIHIRRAVDCEHIEECGRVCDSEKGFSCEGFNYRHPGGTRSATRGRNKYGICELTAMPPSQIDIGRDILQEPRYDYYERDFGCQTNRPFRPSSYPQSSGWMNAQPAQNSYGNHRYHHYGANNYLPELPRPIGPGLGHRPSGEIPRPLGPADHRPRLPELHDNYDNLRRRNQGNWGHGVSEYPRRFPITNLKPIEDDVRFEYFGQGRPYLPKEHQIPDSNVYRRVNQHYQPNDRHRYGYDYHDRRHYANNDLGTNEIGMYPQPGRRGDSGLYSSSWNHGMGYAGSHGYNTNYLDQGHEVVKMQGGYFGPGNQNPKRPLVPQIGEPNRGVYGYGDNRVSPIGGNGDPGYFVQGPHGYGEELCSVRTGAGFKLRRGIVIKSYLTPSLDHCEHLCAATKDQICMTFSYRYTVAASAPTDNCLLSEISYRDLDFYNDIEPDRDYDIYSMTGNSGSCDAGRPTNRRPPEECFWRVRSGCGIPPEVVRKSIFSQGIGDCESECVESQTFTCRSFVYRYSDPHNSVDGLPSANCFLSDWPSQEFDPSSLPDLEGAELYQRGSFGRGCEPSPFPPLNQRRIIRPDPNAGNLPDRPTTKDHVCYAEYKKPCRLTSDAVILSIYVSTESECRQRCSEMRERDTLPCMSCSYRMSSDREEDNCFMSDVPHRDLRPGLDYVHGDGYLLFAWKDFEPRCSGGDYSIGIFLDDHMVSPDFRPNYPHHRPQTPPQDYPDRGYPQGPYSPHLEPPFFGGNNQGGTGGFDGGRYPGADNLGPGGGSYRPSLGHGSRPGIGVNEGGFYSGHPSNPDRPDSLGPSYSGPPGGNLYPDTDSRFGNRYPEDDYYDFSHKHGGSTFRYFTVNGRPCKRGTKCERNKIAGFWSCEPEGGEYGTWDYCCEPKHHCGYSQGYHYPWCYVGPSEDQWRPCSDKYFPHRPANSPPNRPSSDRYTEQEEDNEAFGEIPRPGLLQQNGRHWPVAYLHREAPPNATDLFAAADRRRNRELNVSLNNLKNTSDSESVFRRDNRNAAGGGTLFANSDSQNKINFKGAANNRPGKIERLTKSGENKSNDKNSTHPEIIILKDLKDFNETTESSWEETRFVKLPTISSNQSNNDTNEGFQDYFEVVTVD